MSRCHVIICQASLPTQTSLPLPRVASTRHIPSLCLLPYQSWVTTPCLHHEVRFLLSFSFFLLHCALPVVAWYVLLAIYLGHQVVHGQMGRALGCSAFDYRASPKIGDINDVSVKPSETLVPLQCCSCFRCDNRSYNAQEQLLFCENFDFNYQVLIQLTPV